MEEGKTLKMDEHFEKFRDKFKALASKVKCTVEKIDS
jgi:hypothetical protein